MCVWMCVHGIYVFGCVYGCAHVYIRAYVRFCMCIYRADFRITRKMRPRQNRGFQKRCDTHRQMVEYGLQPQDTRTHQNNFNSENVKTPMPRHVHKETQVVTFLL
jgi:hypothetical protein